MLLREWCKTCGGSGHDRGCRCDSGVAFVLGCCLTCRGEGMVTVYKPEPDPTIILTDEVK